MLIRIMAWTLTQVESETLMISLAAAHILVWTQRLFIPCGAHKNTMSRVNTAVFLYSLALTARHVRELPANKRITYSRRCRKVVGGGDKFLLPLEVSVWLRPNEATAMRNLALLTR